MSESKNSNEETGSALDELRRTRDEIRVKLNLAMKDARDAWSVLEKRLDKAEDEILEAGKQVGDLLSDKLSNLGRSLRDVTEWLDEGRGNPKDE